MLWTKIDICNLKSIRPNLKSIGAENQILKIICSNCKRFTIAHPTLPIDCQQHMEAEVVNTCVSATSIHKWLQSIRAMGVHETTKSMRIKSWAQLAQWDTIRIYTGWWFGTFFYFSPYIGNNHPN